MKKNTKNDEMFMKFWDFQQNFCSKYGDLQLIIDILEKNLTWNIFKTI